jgi:hypothetical protein
VPSLLWVWVGQQLHRAFAISKRDRDLLALAFESGLRVEDLLGQVVKGIAQLSPKS